jgi:hypothetical protein
MFNLLVPNATMVSLADRYDFSVKWLDENALSYFTKLTGGEITDTSENHDGDSGDSGDSGDN